MFKKMALTKKYKPGQLVTINNQVYRIHKTNGIVGCAKCDACYTCHQLEQGFIIGCAVKIGSYGYLKLIKV